MSYVILEERMGGLGLEKGGVAQPELGPRVGTICVSWSWCWASQMPN